MKIDDSGKQAKVWLDDDELEELIEEGEKKDWRIGIAFKLMARAGYRASDVREAQWANLEYIDPDDYDDVEEGYWQLEILTKNTEGTGRKRRYTAIPDDLAREIKTYVRERNKAPNDRLIDRSVPTIRRWVYEAAEERYDKTGDERWLELSSHDLRRTWATNLGVENGVDKDVLQELGGWSNIQSIEPYLGRPSKSKISQEVNK